MKSHLKRITAPKSWPITKKGLKWIKRPFPGSHSYEHGLSLDTCLKNLLNIATTSRDVLFMLNKKTVHVNGRRVKEPRFNVGLFDVITLVEAKKSHRILINEKGLMQALEIKDDEAKLKPARVAGKTLLGKDKFQINLGDSRNLLVKKNQYKVGDTLFLDTSSMKVAHHVVMEKGAIIMLISGKHIGKTGKIADVQGSKIMVEGNDKAIFETKKMYAFPIGKEKPLIALLTKN